MKTLIIVRHAKSDWSNLYLPDYDRTLNDRGLRDAPMMGERLLNRAMKIDQIISSTAKRAEQTAQLLAAGAHFNLENIQWENKLYHAPVSIIDEVIYEASNEVDTLLIVCHNPGVTQFANSISGHLIDDMPTCGQVAFSFETEQWQNFRLAKANLMFYDFPKNGLVL